MKKTTIALLATLCALSAQAVEVAGGTGGESKRAKIPNDAWQDIVLAPRTDNPSGIAYFNANGATVKSLTTTATPNAWNVAFTMTIDTRATGSDAVDALVNNGGAMAWNFSSAYTLKIENTADTESTANIKLGDFTAMTNNSTENGTIDIATKANVSGTSFKTQTGALTLKVSNNANVDWQLTGVSTIDNRAAVEVASGAALNAKSQFTFKSGATYNVGGTATHSGTTLTLEGGSTLNVLSGGTLKLENTAGTFAGTNNIAGTFEYVSTQSRNLTLNNAAISGKLITNIANTQGQGNAQVIFTGTNNVIRDGGQVDSIGALRLNNGSKLTIESTAGTINLKKIKENTIQYYGRILFGGGGELVLNKKDAFVTDNTLGLCQLTVIGGTNANTLRLNADNKFEQLYFQSDSILNIVLGDGVKMNIDNIAGAATSATLFIENFAEDSVFFNKNDWFADTKFDISVSDGSKTYTKDQLKLVEVEGGYGSYVLTAVPEPAEYAAILGAIAIAFGMLQHARRRGENK